MVEVLTYKCDPGGHGSSDMTCWVPGDAMARRQKPKDAPSEPGQCLILCLGNAVGVRIASAWQRPHDVVFHAPFIALLMSFFWLLLLLSLVLLLLLVVVVEVHLVVVSLRIASMFYSFAHIMEERVNTREPFLAALSLRNWKSLAILARLAFWDATRREISDLTKFFLQ